MTSSARLLRRAVWPLWGLLLLALLFILAPLQAGKVAERAMPSALAELAQAIRGQVRQDQYHRDWWRSQASITVTQPALREPVPLHARLRHGPWLGEDGFGWLAIRMEWPMQGGVTPFPPDERLEVALLVDLLGHQQLSFWRQDRAGRGRERLGSIHLSRDARESIGETRLPGLLLKLQRGDLRLAEVNLRARLTHETRHWTGTLGLDARRVGLGQGTDAWLVEDPRAELMLGERDQLTMHWSASQGAYTLGPLDMRLRWHAVDWPALQASLSGRIPRLNDPQRLRRQLDRFGVALDQGEIVLEAFDLGTPSGKLRVEGLLRGRDLGRSIHGSPPAGDASRPNAVPYSVVPTGLRRLHADLRLSLSRPLMIKALRASRWVDDERGADRLLSTLREQQLVSGEDTITTSLNLWDGDLTLSGRSVPLESLLGE
ncbi:MAG: DUF945 family protein [Pseudomonadota bacterium]